MLDYDAFLSVTKKFNKAHLDTLKKAHEYFFEKYLECTEILDMRIYRQKCYDVYLIICVINKRREYCV